MSSSAPPPNPNPSGNPEKKPDDASATSASSNAPAQMDTTPDQPPPEDTFEDLPEDIVALPVDEVLTRIKLLDNDIKVCYLYWSYFTTAYQLSLRSCAQRHCDYNTNRV